MRFGELLKRHREAAGMTQAALAAATGISLRTVQSWEASQRSPVSAGFFIVCQALGVSADAFKAVAEDDQPKKAAPKRPKK